MAKYKVSKVKEYNPSYRTYMVSYKKSRRKARFQNFLFRVFHIRPKYPCGRSKRDKHLCCSSPYDNYADINSVIVFRDGQVTGNFFCNCCGHLKSSISMSEEKYLEEWNGDEAFLYNYCNTF